MTAKRFQYNVNKNCIECDGEFVAYVNSVDGFRIANKLTVLAEENEQLKSFIDDLTTKGTGKIDLANGYSYSVSAVLTNWKGDVE